MKDIVRETGFSQGGVYKYFSNIEEVWLMLSRRYELQINFKAFFEELFAEPNPPQVVLKQVFEFLAQEINHSLNNGFSKLAFEFNTIYISQPELLQAEQLTRQKTHSDNYGYNFLFARIISYLSDCVQSGLLHPRQPLTTVLLFIQVTLDGIIRDATMELYLPDEQQDPDYSVTRNIDQLLDNLYDAVMVMLDY